MIRRAVVLASVLLAGVPATAAAETELNVIPHGQGEPGVAWASRAGMLPASAQALMYDRLTPLGRNVTDAVLAPSADGSGYFKSAKLLAADDPSLITDDTVTAQAGARTLTARIRRDAYGVPHVYSDTDDGVIFGAGYVMAEDRNLLLDLARGNGFAAAIDVPGVSALQLLLGLYTYQPSASVRAEVTRRNEAALKAAGSAGRKVLADIDTYLVGINRWYAQNRPSAARFGRAEVFAVNAFKAQFLGQGGGQEVENALFLDEARDRFGARRGASVYEDLRQRNDPGTSTTTSRRAPYQTAVSVRRPKGVVRLERGSFKSAGIKLPGASPTAAATPAATEGIQRPARQRAPLGDRHADLRGRPAARLQLPRPDVGDRPLRTDDSRPRCYRSALPGLHADRPRRAVRVDAHVGKRGHRRHLRRDALRGLSYALSLQGRVPPDGAGGRRHDLQR